MQNEEDMNASQNPVITDINQLDFDQLYTYADYLKWQFKERVELIKGRIFQMTPAPNRKHQTVLVHFTYYVYTYFLQKKCQLFIAPFDVRLPKKNESGDLIQTVVQPDLCVVCDPSKLDDRGCLGAPDWVIEILSPGNSKKEMENKMSLYEESGVKEYWIVDPIHEHVISFFLDESGNYVAQAPIAAPNSLSPALFPELNIPLEKVFLM